MHTFTEEEILKQFDDRSFKAILEAKKEDGDFKLYENPSLIAARYRVKIKGDKRSPYGFDSEKARADFLKKYKKPAEDKKSSKSIEKKIEPEEEYEDEAKTSKTTKEAIMRDRQKFDPDAAFDVAQTKKKSAEEDEKEPIENYAYYAMLVVKDAIEKLVPRTKIHSAAESALRKFCKSNKIDYDELVDMMGEFVYHNIDKEELDITSLYFLGGI